MIDGSLRRRRISRATRWLKKLDVSPIEQTLKSHTGRAASVVLCARMKSAASGSHF
jgi:hypothetical protein